MNKKRNIIIGLACFVVLITSPFLFNLGKTDAQPQISMDTPVINQLEQKQCVEAAEYMRTEHMQLLNQWRDQVVREGQTVYTSSSGKQYAMSLENSCLECHSNKSEFCDSCHSYTAVDPYCWDCHDASKGAGEIK